MPLLRSRTFDRYVKDQQFRERVDYLFAKVEPYVDEFARDHGLDLDKWYHDLPTWILRWCNEDVTRLIYLVAAQSRRTTALSVAILAYKDDVVRQIRYGLPRAILLSPIPMDKIEKEPYVVTELLTEASTRANNISDQDFKELGHFSRP